MAKTEKLARLSFGPDRVRQDIRSGTLAPVYLFSGPEELLKQEALNALRESVLPEGLEMLNETTLGEATARQIIDAAETFPMMSDRRLVTVRDWPPLMKGKAANEEAEVETLTGWLSNAPETCVTVLYFRGEMYEKGKLTERIKDAVREKHLVPILFEHPTEREMPKHLQRYLKPMGKSIAPDAVSRLLMMVGSDLTTIAGELNKLAAYAGERREITEEDVLAIASPNAEYRIYELTGQLVRGRLAEAQALVNALLRGGENEIGLISLLTMQLRQYAVVAEAFARGDPASHVRENLHLLEGRLRAMQAELRGIAPETIGRAFQLALQTDFEAKSGRVYGRDALPVLIYKIATLPRK